MEQQRQLSLVGQLLRGGIRRAHRWVSATPWRWSAVRIVLAAATAALTETWLSLGHWSLLWHALNGVLVLLQCAAVLATYLSAHPSHSILRHTTSNRPRRSLGASFPLRTDGPFDDGSGGGGGLGAGMSVSASPSRSRATGRLSVTMPSSVETPDTSVVLGNGSGTSAAAAPVVTHGLSGGGATVLARVPLLLPPTPQAARTPPPPMTPLSARTVGQQQRGSAGQTAATTPSSSIGPHIVRRPLLMDEASTRRRS
jgi:hypothetical protein